LNSTTRDEPARIAELEQRLTDSALQLEATARELDAFGATLSHDLRAPLRSIEGFARLLLQAPYTGQLDATGQDYLQRIHTASLRLAQMMDQLLQLVRLVPKDIKSERVDLSGMAQDILAALQAAAPARRAETAVEQGISVTGDARLLRLVLENLLGNAWKFTSGTALANIPSAARPMTAWRRSACATTAPASSRNMPTSCSAPSSACTAIANSKAAASAWPRHSA